MVELWRPSQERISDSLIAGAMTALGEPDYGSLHRRSVADPAGFWRYAWETSGIVGEPGARTFVPGAELTDARFFPDAELNVAATFLARRGPGPALISITEDGTRTDLSHDGLHELVARYQQLLIGADVGIGDRVAAWMPNGIDTVAVMLAAVGLGAVFSSTSPDFGASGVIDRFGQIEPKVLVATDRYRYGGRTFECLERLDEIRSGLPTLRATIVVPSPDGGSPAHSGSFPSGLIDARQALAAAVPADVHFEPLPFDHPWYVLYSSGTTGKPKCIVHRAGGVLVKHLAEHRFQCDVRPGDRVFYYTTTGWMMWNWLVSGLAAGATVILYDGAPFEPDADRLFDLVDETGITLLGVSAKYLDACAKAGLAPVETHGLESLRTICSTGSPLSPEGFAYVYDHVKADVHLASISGGTDLCGCLVAGDPTSPVYAGEIQRPGLGMAIEIVDDEGRPLGPGEQGELTCASAFPSMPLGFWDDPGGVRYRSTYFERFPGRWHQGDFASWSDTGGIVIMGRSDATLNPGGVRIGTAEIYRQVEGVDSVAEALVIGQQWHGDVRIVLFVRMADGADLDSDVEAEIRRRIRSGASPRHVPAVIVAVDDLPRTRSGKLSELAVRDVVAGRPVANTEALANPESLALFVDLAELSR